MIITTLLTSATFFLFLYLSMYRKCSIPYRISIIAGKKEQKKAYWEYIGNYVSIVHAVSVFMMGLYVTLPNGVRYPKDNNYQENMIVAYSLGYFIMDTIMGLMCGFNEGMMIFHHVECVLSLFYVLAKGRYASVIIWALTVAELSNPFILARKNIQKHIGFDGLAEAFGIVFSVLFLISRTYFVGIVMLPLYKSEASLALKLHGGLLWYISLYWCNTIFNLLTKALYEMTNFWLLGELYLALKRFRKNPNGHILLHASIGAVCFVRTFVSWNHAEVF